MAQTAVAAGRARPGVDIRDVWADNLEDAMRLIRVLVQHYPYVAMVRARV